MCVSLLCGMLQYCQALLPGVSPQCIVPVPAAPTPTHKVISVQTANPVAKAVQALHGRQDEQTPGDLPKVGSRRSVGVMGPVGMSCMLRIHLIRFWSSVSGLHDGSYDKTCGVLVYVCMRKQSDDTCPHGVTRRMYDIGTPSNGTLKGGGYITQ